MQYRLEGGDGRGTLRLDAGSFSQDGGVSVWSNTDKRGWTIGDLTASLFDPASPKPVGSIYFKRFVATDDSGVDHVIIDAPEYGSDNVLPYGCSIPFSIGLDRSANHVSYQRGGWGPTKLDPTEVDHVLQKHTPYFAVDLTARRKKLWNQRGPRLGWSEHFGEKDGAGVGGDGIDFWSEAFIYDTCITDAWNVARRVAHRMHVCAYHVEDGRPLCPEDWATSYERIPFLLYAGVDNTPGTHALPYFQRPMKEPTPWHVGDCTYEAEMLRYKRHDDQHYSRALQGLLTLMTYDKGALCAWAKRRFLSYSYHLQLSMPIQRRTKGDVYTLGASLGREFVNGPLGAGGRALAWKKWVADWTRWVEGPGGKSEAWCDGIDKLLRVTTKPNGFAQCREHDKQNWTDPVWTQFDPLGRMMGLEYGCGLTFQQQLMDQARLACRPSRGDLDQVKTSMDTQGRFFQTYKFDGRRGPAYAIAGTLLGNNLRPFDREKHAWGKPAIDNAAGGWALHSLIDGSAKGAEMALESLGTKVVTNEDGEKKEVPLTAAEGMARIVEDSAHDYKGSVKTNAPAILALAALAGTATELPPPDRFDPPEGPKPVEDPPPIKLTHEERIQMLEKRVSRLEGRD